MSTPSALDPGSDHMVQPATGTAAILITGYGGPCNLDEVESFITELTGRTHPPAVVESIRRKYLTVGGCSPLHAVAGQFADALSAAINERNESHIPVELGFRYSQPRIAEVMRRFYTIGVRDVITVSLSPFESKITTVAYRSTIDKTLEDLPGMRVIETPLLGSLPAYIHAHASNLDFAISELPSDLSSSTLVVFSAHSLPIADLLGAEDPYVCGIRAASDQAAALLQLPGGKLSDSLLGVELYGSDEGRRHWAVAYQSTGNKPGAWLGPSLEDVVGRAAKHGYQAVAVCPIGFLTEHMETMYDLDVEIADLAISSGIEFARSPAPSSEPTLINALADELSAMITR